MATAWGDESVRKTGVPSPMYLMGACVCDDTETETRQRLALLKPKGARKLHWRDMRPSLRGKVVDAMAAMDIDHVIVAAVPMSQWNTAERARRKCLERLLPLLETEYNVDTLVLERREYIIPGEYFLSEDVDTYINLKKIYEENKASIVSTEPHLEKIEYTDSQDKLFPKIRTESCEDAVKKFLEAKTMSDITQGNISISYSLKDIGRFNQAAARHIMADVALWNEDWQTVLDQIEAIETSGAGYELVDIDKIFNGENLNHSEALLVQQWSRNPGGNNLADNGAIKGHFYACWFIAPYRTTFGGDEYCCVENWSYGWGRCYPSPYLFSLYKDKTVDKRYKAFYIHQYKNSTNKTIRGVKPGEYITMTTGGSVDKNLCPGCTKYGDVWTRSTTEQYSYKDIIVYRLAETYILATEAAVRMGNNDLAKKYFNKTWMRAGNPEFTGTVTMQDVIDEQARELALEGQRWYFLKRHGILIDQVKKYAGDPRISTSIAGRVNLPKNPHFVRWPIPEAEVINMGPENFPQNEGYN